ncbi:hypothetical protein JTB14_008037 [Gonioctena quinquepunctata]|nr:hypothetical protein JTB14_008037 [Gonioctena quinquepunctata]
MTHLKVTPYHHKSNGLAKRAVRTFKERMRASDEKMIQSQRLQPYVMKNLEYEQFVQKQHHDSTAAPDQNLIGGEEVWVNNPPSKGSLPGKIVKRTGFLSYLVEIDGILRRKHCDQMRKRK